MTLLASLRFRQALGHPQGNPHLGREVERCAQVGGTLSTQEGGQVTHSWLSRQPQDFSSKPPSSRFPPPLLLNSVFFLSSHCPLFARHQWAPWIL